MEIKWLLELYMSWTDKKSIEQMLKLRDQYSISTFVETGCFRGVNSRLHSFYWENVLSCDIFDEYLDIARRYNYDRNNVSISKQDSSIFLRSFVSNYFTSKRTDIIFFYLDAHFYDPSLPYNIKWAVVNELKSLYGFTNCVICIHDFNCSNLGHCCYGGEPLGFPLVLPHLRRINPNFYYYINYKESCDIHNEDTIKNVKELVIDEAILDTMRFVNSSDLKKYRGILYCTPTEIDISKYDLKRA
jgi:hypothetical protein